MESVDPIVSIVVRTKDRPVLLERALRSIAAQTYRPIEVVVVNDGGCALAESHLADLVPDATLSLVPLPATSGRAHAANVGLARASGGWVGLLDDDDELLPEHVATLVAAATRLDAAVVYSDCEMVHRDIAPSGELLHEESEGRFFMSRDFSAPVLLFENYIPLICILFRRDAVSELGGFDEALELYEDWDFLLRAAERHRFHHVGEITCRYVQWSRTSQIAFSGAVDGESAYLHVLGKHISKIDARAILAYYGAKQHERRSDVEKYRTLEREVRGLESRLAHAGRELEAKDRALLDAASEMAHVRSRLGEVTRALDSITRSRAWKLIELYRHGIKERLLGADTTRRKLYNRLLHTGDYRPQSGGADVAAVPLPPTSQIVRERFVPPAVTTTTAAQVASKVSIVIPTFNGGPGLRPVLERLRGQEGVPGLEIIAVDSGSTDGTPALCEKYGVTVVPYPAASFNHGLARNVGASRASGDILIFMSQDAYPAGTGVVADLVRAMGADPKLAAISARQVPRSDADLFTCWQIWCYREKVLGYDADTVVSLERDQLAAVTPPDRHRAAQIDNVFSCVRRDVFERLQFRHLPIAEDLDLGLRVLEHGYRIGFMTSVAVVHSHNRLPAYHLRRSYSEWRTLPELLGYDTLRWPGLDGSSIAPVVRAAESLYRRVGAAVAACSGSGVTRFSRLTDTVRSALREPPAVDRTVAEPSLDAAFRELAHALELGPGSVVQVHLDPFQSCYLGLLDSFAEFLSRRQAADGEDGAFATALFKLCAEAAGHCLADFGDWAERRGGSPAGLAAVDAVLRRNV